MCGIATPMAVSVPPMDWNNTEERIAKGRIRDKDTRQPKVLTLPPPPPRGRQEGDSGRPDKK
jgi:hypothetical protein